MAFGKPEPSVRELVTMVVVLKEGFESVRCRHIHIYCTF